MKSEEENFDFKSLSTIPSSLFLIIIHELDLMAQLSEWAGLLRIFPVSIESEKMPSPPTSIPTPLLGQLPDSNGASFRRAAVLVGCRFKPTYRGS